MGTSWQDRYRKKLTSAEIAVSHVKRGGRVFVGSGCSEPQLLVGALEETGKKLADTEIIHTLTLGVAPYVNPHFVDHFRHNAFFVGPNVRSAVFEGRADYTPILLSEIPRLFKNGRISIDVALIQVSPPDEHGFCSLGVAVDIVKAAAENAAYVVAEVNPNMPRTLGDAFVRVDRLDALVESNEPILEWMVPSSDVIAARIARNVSTLVENGATLQIGIGSIPNSVLGYLKDRKDLGVHTEMFSDAIIDLIEAGAITNARKTLHPGKIVATFCMGSRRLYDYIDNNPLFEFHPSDYVNDPFVISRNDRMIAINAALEVDLTGQVCADSLGYLFYSGIGGHADFIRGAARSSGGKPIIVLPSTTDDGKKSRIVPHLSEGAGVVTTRGDVHYVVTEHGIAFLHGKSIRERAMALISVAHPRFRRGLLAAAKKHHYVYLDQVLPPGGTTYPSELEKQEILKDGTAVLFRPVKTTDERELQRFYYSLSQESVIDRFFAPRAAFPHVQAQLLVNIDYEEHMGIIGIVGPPGAEKIIAVGEYFVDHSTNTAEVAVIIADKYQNRKIGSTMLNHLAQIGRQRGLVGFTAEVRIGNARMLRLLLKVGRTVESRIAGETYLLSLRF
ncbi:MAG: GNAT family N-acetyltransferase [Chloroflexi bacterium]|nr:GNAT family N-acetyltransferase [Chloroflexota bacterium]